MGRKFNESDPTANKAIGNVDRERRQREALKGQSRPFMDQFEAEVEDLLLRQALQVFKLSITLAGGDRWAVQRHHVIDARRRLYDQPSGGDAA